MKIVEIKRQIEDLEEQLKDIQNECKHPKSALDKKHGSSTGNYDPSADSYWTDLHCGLCDKKWQVEGSV